MGYTIQTETLENSIDMDVHFISLPTEIENKSYNELIGFLEDHLPDLDLGEIKELQIINGFEPEIIEAMVTVHMHQLRLQESGTLIHTPYKKGTYQKNNNSPPLEIWLGMREVFEKNEITTKEQNRKTFYSDNRNSPEERAYKWDEYDLVKSFKQRTIQSLYGLICKKVPGGFEVTFQHFGFLDIKDWEDRPEDTVEHVTESTVLVHFPDEAYGD